MSTYPPFYIYLQISGRDKVDTPRYTGKTEADAVAAIGKKLRKTLVTDQLATNPDPKECIACKTVRGFLKVKIFEIRSC